MIDMKKPITRRDFLKGCASAAAGLASFFMLGQNVFALEESAQAASTTDSTLAIVRNPSKCIGCGQCVAVCRDTQKINVLEMVKKDGKTYSALKDADTLSNSRCISCGQCSRVCPVGAITETDALQTVTKAISSGKYIVWQFAPSVQNLLGEVFGLPSGMDVSGKLAAAARQLSGANTKVFRTDFGADITIVEEVTELIDRIQNNGTLPMITSCCPGWIRHAEQTYPTLLSHISTCKSPQQMLGALIKNYLPQKESIDASSIFHVSVMPCTAKKYECAREEMEHANLRDVDAVLTAREFANLLHAQQIDLQTLPAESFDTLFGNTSGAGRIFGSSGGVCEAALRTLSEKMNGETLDAIEFTALRGNEKIKTASLTIDGKTIKACVINGIGNVERILNSTAMQEYTFIEVMACPDGCVGGGGTPLYTGTTAARGQGLYDVDRRSRIRKSHENKALQQIYTEYLETPCSELSHELLHTTYTNRS